MGTTVFKGLVQADGFIGGFSEQLGGKNFFVNNATSGLQEGAVGASDGNSGESPTEALSTIQEAIDRCVSGRGDRIIVFPGSYDENLTITSKDYITIQGALNAGYARPDVVPTTGKALVIDNSQGIVLRHVRFASADADTVTNEGNGFLFEDCVFDGDAGQAATETNLRLVGDGADDSYTASEGKIINCLFRNCGGDALMFQHAAAPSGVGITDVEVIGCRFYGNTGDDISTVANVSGGGAGIVSRINIAHNYFMTTDKAVYLDLDNASFTAGDELLNDGTLAGNYFADDAALTATKIDISGTNLRWVGGYNGVGIVDGSAFDN